MRVSACKRQKGTHIHTKQETSHSTSYGGYTRCTTDPCWAAARSTPSCKDGGARMARALQAEGGDGLVAGLAGRPRSNGLRWAGAPHSSAPRSSCWLLPQAHAHVAAVAVRPKSPHESPQLLEVKSPVIKRRMVGGWCRRGLRCAAGAGAPIG